MLGGDDGNECTYGAGYLKRQAVFSCLTCVPDGVAGVCTACCLACHDGHEVIPSIFTNATCFEWRFIFRLNCSPTTMKLD